MITKLDVIIFLMDQARVLLAEFYKTENFAILTVCRELAGKATELLHQDGPLN